MLVVTVLGDPPPALAAGAGKLVLVLDSSGSMQQRVAGEAKIDIAKQALRTVIGRLPDDAQVGLRVYGATVENRGDAGACTDSQLVVPIGTGNRTALSRAVKKYRPYGETPIAYALGQAAEDLGNTGRRSVVLVSDGQETCDADPCGTAAALARRGIDLKFDVIGLRVSGRARDQLRCIADRGRGSYYDADNAAAIADSLDRLTTRAFRPFRISGDPVHGNTDRQRAPLVGPGRYVDTFPTDGSTLYYRLARSAPGTTLHVGVTAEAAGFLPTLNLGLETISGFDCGSGSVLVANVAGTRRLVSAEANSWQPADPACRHDGELLLWAGQPLRGVSGRPLELVVVEEPALIDPTNLEPAQPSPRWVRMRPGRPTTPPPPGLSLSDAPTVRPRTYAGTILTGEKQVFAVDLDWGQWLQAQVLVAPRTGALAQALGSSDSLDLQLLGAMRGVYASGQVPGQPTGTRTMATDDATCRVSAATPTIRYLNRADLDLAPAGLPGPQYIVLSKSRVTGEKEFLVPYTLVLGVSGTAGRGAPLYAPATTPSPTPASSTSTPVPATPPAPAGSARGRGNPLETVAVLMSAGLVLGAAATIVAARRRKRRRVETASRQRR